MKLSVNFLLLVIVKIILVTSSFNYRKNFQLSTDYATMFIILVMIHVPYKYCLESTHNNSCSVIAVYLGIHHVVYKSYFI